LSGDGQAVLNNNIPVAFAVTYLVGVIAAAWVLSQLAPMLMRVDLITKNWVEAEQTLERLRTASKNSVVAIMAEGRLRQAQGQLDKAVIAYDRAVTLAPNDPEPLVTLVKLDVAQRHATAQKPASMLLATMPDHPFGHGLLGEVWLSPVISRKPISSFEATRVNPNGSPSSIGGAVDQAEAAGAGLASHSGRAQSQSGERGIADASGIGLLHARPNRSSHHSL
jgi:hypothetical protein